MLRLVIFAGLFGLGQCGKDETIAGYGASGQLWQLSEIDGTAFAATVTVTFPEPGKIGGNAPCNTYTGTMDAPYPWFEIGPLAVTRMACPDLEFETDFLAALAEMSVSEVSGDTMILSNDAGREMVFKASE
jgi:heat shock protein HslJ